LVWHPYCGIPGIIALHNGDYRHQPDWYRNFVYTQERERGLDFTEDLAAPGTFRFDLAGGEGVLVFAAEGFANGEINQECTAETLLSELRAREKTRRAAFATPLDRATDAYLVKRGKGKTIIAGYPWFSDWGRDTFISLRGLCLATGRLDDARDILLEWSNVVSEGMLPNLFPDQSDRPEYNSVDASLWYVVAVHEFLAVTKKMGGMISQGQKKSLQKAVAAILSGYLRGTRYGIHMDKDGLLAAGVPGVQLTWMDAKVGDHVVTPRIGKPVEIQALWLHALVAASKRAAHFSDWAKLARSAFEARFWNEQRGMLFDVVDDNHVPGALDGTCRPNQIFAAGGLPITLLGAERARRVVDAVERELWTPLGLRSLEPGDPRYVAHYQGDAWQRDCAYHQGTVWPWLIGPFVEAWLKLRGGTREAKSAARARFLAPLYEHLDHAGLGHVSEIADAEPPFTPRGCPFQAWSVGELLRLERDVLA
jgi:predicted glycogen debranching enzyme